MAQDRIGTRSSTRGDIRSITGLDLLHRSIWGTQFLRAAPRTPRHTHPLPARRSPNLSSRRAACPGACLSHQPGQLECPVGEHSLTEYFDPHKLSHLQGGPACGRRTRELFPGDPLVLHQAGRIKTVPALVLGLFLLVCDLLSSHSTVKMRLSGIAAYDAVSLPYLGLSQGCLAP
jgi:hypothetical protein